MTNNETANTENSTFLITKEYRRFEEFCNACRRDRYIGICYGSPGVGKTLSARHYTKWDLIEDRDPFDLHAIMPLEVAECRTVLYTPSINNSPRQINEQIEHNSMCLRSIVGKAERDPASNELPDYRDCCELLIVDEADRLKMSSLEQLRDMYDRGRFGLVLIGMPSLEKRIARYPQFYSRVGFAHAFRPLSNEEMQFVLAHHWQRIGSKLKPDDFTDQEAVSTIVRVTSGNFRLVQRLFMQIERILNLNDLKTVTREVVEAARECLVIGAH